MKKKYINPEIQVVKMLTSTLICTSPLYNVQVNTTVEMEEEEEFE